VGVVENDIVIMTITPVGVTLVDARGGRVACKITTGDR
jgi:hypothetical protein